MSSDLKLIERESEDDDYEEPWTPRLIDVVAPVFFISYVGFGSLIYTWAEDWSSWSSIWFCIITLSTVGYGDMTPSTDWMKMFTLLYVYGGLFFFATVMGSRIGRSQENQVVNGDLWEDIDRTGWPEVPIDGGLRKPVRTPRVVSLYRQDLRRRWLRITKVGIVIFLLASISTIFFASNEQFSASTAVYFTMVTMCTVGYGDIVLSKPSTKVFDVFFVLIGVSLLIYIIILVVALFSKKMNRRMFKNFSKKGITLDVIISLADSETGKVQRPDFLAYMLVHSGKVKALDINKINELFDDIDVNESGEVDLNDMRAYMKDKSLLDF